MNHIGQTVDPHVQALWGRIYKMEQERRFNGRSYPEGMAPFPFQLTGQGFFPGGDGLWRGESQLLTPSQCQMPVNGIMFLGNDFGNLQSFEKLLGKGYENPPTWRNLRSRLTRAGIPGELGFYTNALLGLRTVNKALDVMDWTSSPDFLRFCREFLDFQIETVRPRLVVVLGPKAKETVCSAFPTSIIPTLARWKGRDLNMMSADDAVQQGEWNGLKLTILLTSQPYSDLSKSDALKAEDGRRLAQAWSIAQ
jgi:hypothetical protein